MPVHIGHHRIEPELIWLPFAVCHQSLAARATGTNREGRIKCKCHFGHLANIVLVVDIENSTHLPPQPFTRFDPIRSVTSRTSVSRLARDLTRIRSIPSFGAPSTSCAVNRTTGKLGVRLRSGATRSVPHP